MAVTWIQVKSLTASCVTVTNFQLSMSVLRKMTSVRFSEKSVLTHKRQGTINSDYHESMVRLYKLFYVVTNLFQGPGLFSRYSDSLRCRRSGDRILVGVRISASLQTVPGAHQTSYTMGTGSFPGGKAAGAWHWPTPRSHLAPKLKEE